MSFARDRTARSRFTSLKNAGRARCIRCAASSRLAIWDARDGQLFAARDRFGIKPLYYTIHDGTFFLASEVKAFAELGVPLRWDRETLHDVHFVAHPPDRTLFAGIYQLPPASCLFTDGEQVRVLPYWDWDYPTPTRCRRGKTSASGLPASRARSRTRSGCDCARTCRSRVT